MRTGQPRHATDPKRSAGDRSEYMKNYMADRRHNAAHLVRARAASLYDITRNQLRDGSGTLMWPLRVKESETPMSDGWKEIAAAERRRRRSTPAAPIKTPTPRPKIGPGRRAFEKNLRRGNHAGN